MAKHDLGQRDMIERRLDRDVEVWRRAVHNYRLKRAGQPVPPPPTRNMRDVVNVITRDNVL